jgi:ketosteroid isomerase-like protein
VKNILDLVGTNVVTVEWDEDNTTKEGKKVQFSGVTVITLKFGKATHATDYIFNTDEEIRKAWGE